MALTACSECDKEVSDKAAVCPHCGKPMRIPLPTKIVYGILAIETWYLISGLS